MQIFFRIFFVDLDTKWKWLIRMISGRWRRKNEIISTQQKNYVTDVGDQGRVVWGPRFLSCAEPQIILLRVLKNHLFSYLVPTYFYLYLTYFYLFLRKKYLKFFHVYYML